MSFVSRELFAWRVDPVLSMFSTSLSISFPGSSGRSPSQVCWPSCCASSLFSRKNPTGAYCLHPSAFVVVASCGSAIFLLGGKVISQTREFVGTAADWPQQIHDKVKNSEYVSPESLDAISTQVDAFKKYWKELIGTGGKTLDLSLSPEEKPSTTRFPKKGRPSGRYGKTSIP